MSASIKRLGQCVALVCCLTMGYLAGQAVAGGNHMQEARDNLQDARKHLQQASNDKGGHRKKALELVNEAIEQVNKGIAYKN